MSVPEQVLTITPNPSLDRAFDVQALEPGEVNRALRCHTDAGGKGVNISRALALHGIDSVAVFPSGGPDGALLVAELQTQNIACNPVAIGGAIRSNVTIVDEAGSTTKINAPGPTLTADEESELLAQISLALQSRPQWVVAAGSLPAGVGADLYVRIAQAVAVEAIPFALDTSGEALAAAAKVGGIALLKPNDDELSELLGRPLSTVGDVVDGARNIMDSSANGILMMLVSLGAHGALLVTATDSWWAGGTPLVPLSTVGAGDTTLAGFLSAVGDPAVADAITLAHALRTAIAWGRAAVLLPGSAAPGPHQIDPTAVRVVANPAPSHLLKELSA